MKIKELAGQGTSVLVIWAIDFMFDYLESGRRLKVRNIIDEFSKISPGGTIEPDQVIKLFNSIVRDECLNEHIFFDLPDTREKIEIWHSHYNNFNPHS